MQRELDFEDISLLQQMAAIGDIPFTTPDEQRRLQRLELEGYVASVRRDPPGLDAPPKWVYRLTLKGGAIVANR